jgi:cold shock CspA family protein
LTVSERIVGTVVTWLDEKGFGFVRRDDGGPDCFVHVKALNGVASRLEVGELVSFVITTAPDGRTRADAVRME